MASRLLFCRFSDRIPPRINCHIMLHSIRKKAQEVSFVLLKIAGYIRHKELATRMESIAYQIIESLYSGDMEIAVSKVDSAIGLASLGSNIGEINQNNSAIILRELENLKNGIRQYKESQSVREMPSIEGLFSKAALSAPVRQKVAQNSSHKATPVVKQSDSAPASSIDTGNGSIIRQDMILAKIKSAPASKLQLRDIIAAFPNISERTLRYDLVKLCQIGSLRREGAGGPSNFYVASDSQVAASVSPAAEGGVIDNKPVSL